MKSLDELKSYYEVTMVPQLMKLEEKRKNLRTRMIIADIFIFLLVLVTGGLVVIYVPKVTICLLPVVLAMFFIFPGLHFLNICINMIFSG